MAEVTDEGKRFLCLKYFCVLNTLLYFPHPFINYNESCYDALDYLKVRDRVLTYCC